MSGRQSTDGPSSVNFEKREDDSYLAVVIGKVLCPNDPM